MPPQGGQCPYCQLIDNPGQLLVVDETDNFYAWLEVQPRARGHTQVVPKEHIASVMEMDEEQYMEMQRLVMRVMHRAKEGLGADGVSVTMNVEEAGGQMLPHAYVSVFPRFQDEENAGTPTGAIFPQREELQQQLQEVQQSMESASIDLGGESHDVHPDSERFKDDDEVGRILESDSFGSGDDSEMKEEPDQEEEDAGEGSGPEAGEDAGSSVSEMSRQDVLDELMSRYGSPGEMLESEEFRQLISDSGYIVRKQKDRFEGGFDWN